MALPPGHMHMANPPSSIAEIARVDWQSELAAGTSSTDPATRIPRSLRLPLDTFADDFVRMASGYHLGVSQLHQVVCVLSAVAEIAHMALGVAPSTHEQLHELSVVSRRMKYHMDAHLHASRLLKEFRRRRSVLFLRAILAEADELCHAFGEFAELHSGAHGGQGAISTPSQPRRPDTSASLQQLSSLDAHAPKSIRKFVSVHQHISRIAQHFAFVDLGLLQGSVHREVGQWQSAASFVAGLLVAPVKRQFVYHFCRQDSKLSRRDKPEWYFLFVERALKRLVPFAREIVDPALWAGFRALGRPDAASEEATPAAVAGSSAHHLPRVSRSPAREPRRLQAAVSAVFPAGVRSVGPLVVSAVVGLLQLRVESDLQASSGDHVVFRWVVDHLISLHVSLTECGFITADSPEVFAPFFAGPGREGGPDSRSPSPETAASSRNSSTGSLLELWISSERAFVNSQLPDILDPEEGWAAAAQLGPPFEPADGLSELVSPNFTAFKPRTNGIVPSVARLVLLCETVYERVAIVPRAAVVASFMTRLEIPLFDLYRESLESRLDRSISGLRRLGLLHQASESCLGLDGGGASGLSCGKEWIDCLALTSSCEYLARLVLSWCDRPAVLRLDTGHGIQQTIGPRQLCIGCAAHFQQLTDRSLDQLVSITLSEVSGHLQLYVASLCADRGESPGPLGLSDFEVGGTSVEPSEPRHDEWASRRPSDWENRTPERDSGAARGDRGLHRQPASQLSPALVTPLAELRVVLETARSRLPASTFRKLWKPLADRLDGLLYELVRSTAWPASGRWRVQLCVDFDNGLSLLFPSRRSAIPLTRDLIALVSMPPHARLGLASALEQADAVPGRSASSAAAASALRRQGIGHIPSGHAQSVLTW